MYMYMCMYIHLYCMQAILGRKLIVEDMHKLMYKIAQLSVTSDSDTTRQHCRQVPIHSYTHSHVPENVAIYMCRL